MLNAKHQRPGHKAKTRDYSQKQSEATLVLRQARALARSGMFANHQEVARELDRLFSSERAQEWFKRFEIKAQLDTLCALARSRDVERT